MLVEPVQHAAVDVAAILGPEVRVTLVGIDDELVFTRKVRRACQNTRDWAGGHSESRLPHDK
jgi:hypothetical protein